MTTVRCTLCHVDLSRLCDYCRSKIFTGEVPVPEGQNVRLPKLDIRGEGFRFWTDPR